MSEKKISNDADAISEIFEWSKNRPTWQQTALKRLVQNAELTEVDINELTQLSKSDPKEPETLKPSDLPDKSGTTPKVSIMSIRSTRNVNALAEGQTLTFIPEGVTIVYGDNGAGKSGYVRILKSACRARTPKGKPDEILPNIYDDNTGEQTASIEFLSGAQKLKSSWINGAASDALLNEVSVFDSRTASVHVDETNDLAYTPYPLRLLEKLVQTCKHVEGNLRGEIEVLEDRTPESLNTPQVSAGTKVAKLIEQLSAETKSIEVESLSSLTEAESKHLEQLRADFSSGAEGTIKTLNSYKSRLENLDKECKLIESAASIEQLDFLHQCATDLSAKSVAADLARDQFSEIGELDGIGSATWKNLWSAARAFSETEAYPDKAFPVTNELDLCVLCQQPLSSEATQRLIKFEEFVKDRTQTQKIDAQSKFDDQIRKLTDAKSDWRTVRGWVQFLRDELGDEKLASEAKRFFTMHRWRLSRAVFHPYEKKWVQVCAAPDFAQAVTEIDNRVRVLSASEDNPERKARRHDLAELEDRQWLAKIKNDVVAQIERLTAIKSLKESLTSTRPNAITQLATALSKALITDRLRTQFTKEVDELRLARLAVELKQGRSQLGVSRFKIALTSASSNNAGEILSEGEYRCVALAGFLAELATNDSFSGIIFDDPVSSLDHLHRQAIANRLAKEGRNRQVIVFTHDLPFLFMLKSACSDVGSPSDRTEFQLRHIQKREDKPGYCRNEPPDKAQGTKERLNALKSHLQNTSIHYDRDPDGLDWLIVSRGIIDSLRQGWESAVEDTISPVLKTFASKVDTRGYSRLTAITESDASIMRKRYGYCSELLHKTSDKISPVAPTPTEISLEIEELEKWHTDVTNRQKSVSTA